MNKKVIIIAEAGVNHNGDINIAKRLIDAAAEAGADYVKFQTFKAETVVSPKAKKAGYQIKNIKDGDDSQFLMLKKLEIPDFWYPKLLERCNKKGIKFFSTAFDTVGVNYLNNLGLDIFKIPSGEITNYPYLKAIALCAKPVIMSTGMCTENEIKQAVNVLIEFGLLKENISILHCNTEYPTPMIDVNLKAMLSIREKFGIEIGYSDHTIGIEVPIAAVALGATIIEKHFTLDRTLPGPDHVASLEPKDLKAMVNTIRNIELAISGSGVKKPSDSEIKNIDIVRKSIHFTRDISFGEIIEEDDIIPLRPGNGISPMEWKKIIGKKLLKDYKAFSKLEIEDII
jgi:N,N'-diacetyllegionaminate synthase